tara:strand:+ start:1226 stop:1546 length:321 start_codon:yes stop_codon:yes gene_type:complete
MSEVKKENPLVIKGIKTFKKNDNAPDFVVCDGVLTPKHLMDHLKEHADLLADARQVYNGDVQFKFQVTTNDYGSLTFKFNTYKAKPKADSPPDTEPMVENNDDLPW